MEKIIKKLEESGEISDTIVNTAGKIIESTDEESAVFSVCEKLNSSISKLTDEAKKIRLQKEYFMLYDRVFDLCNNIDKKRLSVIISGIPKPQHPKLTEYELMFLSAFFTDEKLVNIIKNISIELGITMFEVAKSFMKKVRVIQRVYPGNYIQAEIKKERIKLQIMPPSKQFDYGFTLFGGCTIAEKSMLKYFYFDYVITYFNGRECFFNTREDKIDEFISFIVETEKAKENLYWKSVYKMAEEEIKIGTSLKFLKKLYDELSNAKIESYIC